MVPVTPVPQRVSVKSFVYLKVIEARDLRGVGTNGATDCHVMARFKGGSHVRAASTAPSANPQWYQECILANPPPNDVVIQLLVAEARPGTSSYVQQFHAPVTSTPLGKVDVPLTALTKDGLNEMWLPLNRGGELHVWLQHVLPSARLFAQPPLLASTNLNFISHGFQFDFPPLRIQLERNKYFPGEIVRGALVYNTPITTKIPILHIEITGETASWIGDFVSGEGSNRSWFSYAVLLNDPKTKLVLTPGAHVFPFEFHLPMEVAPSVELSQECFTRYQFYAAAAKPGKRQFDLPGAGFDICSPSARYPASPKSFLPPNFPTNASKSPNSLASLKAAPSLVWSNHKYTFTCCLHNTEKHPAQALIMTLKKKVVLVTLGLEGDIRDAQVHESQSLSNEHLVDTNRVEASSNMFPIESGSTWEGTITVRMPGQMEPSIHCTESPLIQISYVLCISLKCGSSECKQFEYPVVVCGRNWSPNGIVPPMKPVGTPFRFDCIKNADPALYHASLVPNLRADTIQKSGRSFPPLEPNPEELQKEPLKTRKDGVPWRSQWTSGTMPPWFAKRRMKMSPHDEFFSREAMFPGLTEYAPVEKQKEQTSEAQPSSPPITPAAQDPPIAQPLQHEPQASPSQPPSEPSAPAQESPSLPAAPASPSWRFAKTPSRKL